MEEPAIDLVYWTNVFGGCSLGAYGFFLWAQVRGMFAPSPEIIYLVRFLCVTAFVSPIAVRMYLSEQTVLFLGLMLAVVGLLIKLRRIMGV